MDAGGVAQIRPANACKASQESTGRQLVFEKGGITRFGAEHLQKDSICGG